MIRKRCKLTSEEIRAIPVAREVQYKGHRLRAVLYESEVWVVVADVALALDYKAPTTRIVASLREDEVRHIDLGLRNCKSICVNQSGLYAITRFSGKPNAKDLYRFCEKAVFKSPAQRTSTEVMEHFGYMEGIPLDAGIGCWPNDADLILKRLAMLPEVLKRRGALKRKIRIVFDYDPDFPRALLQVWGLETISADELSNLRSDTQQRANQG